MCGFGLFFGGFVALVEAHGGGFADVCGGVDGDSGASGFEFGVVNFGDDGVLVAESFGFFDAAFDGCDWAELS